MADLLEGYDSESGEDFCEDVYNLLKNHWRQADPLANLAGRTEGMIVSDSDDNKLYHITDESPPCDEILQATNSFDVIPYFLGVDLWSGVYHHIIRASAAEGLAGADLRIGLDESLRSLIVMDRGDLGVDLGLVAQSYPTLYVFDADYDSYIALNHSADDKPQVVFQDGTDMAVIRHLQEPGLGGRLTIGLDETARTMVICDYGDVDADLGLAASSSPSLLVYSVGATSYCRIRHNFVYSSIILEVAGAQGVKHNIYADLTSGNAFTFVSQPNMELIDNNAEQAWIYIEPKINQTLTAGYVAILLDVTETSLGDASAGAGYNALMDLRISGTTQFGIQNDGKIMTNQTAAATTLGSVTDKLPIYDGTGTIVGYIPIYDSIT